MMEKEVPEILLLDVRLPEENGMDIVCEMHKDEGFADKKSHIFGGECVKGMP